MNGFINHLFHLNWTFFSGRKKGDLISRLFDNEKVQVGIQKFVSDDILEFLTLLASLLIIFFYDDKLALILLFLLPVYFVIVSSVQSKFYQANRRLLESYSKSESQFIDNLDGIYDIQHAGKIERFTKKMNSDFSDYHVESAVTGNLNAKYLLVISLFGTLTMTLIFSYCVAEVSRGLMEIGNMVAIFSIAGMCLSSTLKLATLPLRWQEAKAALVRSNDIMTIPVESEGGVILSDLYEVRTNGLLFHFPGKLDLFRPISIQVRIGEMVVITGNNGIGKSTFMSLILGMYKPTSGDIYYNSLSQSELNLNSIRTQFGYVSQHTKIFNNSLLFNITFDESVSQEEVMSFLEKWEFVEFPNRFELGLVTILGEEGFKVSGGERQLIGLLRALYREPRFLLLDEVAAFMDGDLKDKVVRLVWKLTRNSVGILAVSHDEVFSDIATTMYRMEKPEYS